MFKLSKRKKRYLNIDLLRGLAMFLIILLHSMSPYLNDKKIFFIWNWLHFAVPIFIFCSAYIFFKKNYQINSLKEYFFYLKKRFKRLIFPYYIFLAFYFFLSILSKRPIQKNFIFQNLFLSGGISINWLVLLFLLLAFAIPIVKYLEKKKVYFYTLFLLSFASSFYFLSNRISSWRWVMIMPWLVVVYFTWFYQKLENKPKDVLIKLLVPIFSLSTLLIFLNVLKGKSLNFFANKYPPNAFYIFYGLSVLLLLLRSFKKIRLNPIFNFLLFNSHYSYSLYFISELVIFFIENNFETNISFPIFSLFIFFISYGILFVFNVPAIIAKKGSR